MYTAAKQLRMLHKIPYQALPYRCNEPAFWIVFGPTMDAADVTTAITRCTVLAHQVPQGLSEVIRKHLAPEVFHRLVHPSGPLVRYYNRSNVTYPKRRIIRRMFPYAILSFPPAERCSEAVSLLQEWSPNFFAAVKAGWITGPQLESQTSVYYLAELLLRHLDKVDMVLSTLRLSQEALFVLGSQPPPVGLHVLDAGLRHVIHLEMHSNELLNKWLAACATSDRACSTLSILIMHLQQSGNERVMEPYRRQLEETFPRVLREAEDWAQNARRHAR